MKKQFDGIFLAYAYCVHPKKVLFYRKHYGKNDYFEIAKERIDGND